MIVGGGPAHLVLDAVVLVAALVVLVAVTARLYPTVA